MDLLNSQPGRSSVRPAAVALVALVALIMLVTMSWISYQNSHLSIFDAVRVDDLERVRVLLKDKPDLVLSNDNDGWTLMHWAVWKDHKDIVELLLVQGADVNAKNRYGQTPLHFTADCGFPKIADREMVELLLTHGADVNAKSLKFGQTPLQWAVNEGCTEIVKSLLAHGADIHIKTDTGSHGMAPEAFEEEGNNNSISVGDGTLLNMATNERVADVLLTNKADVNAKDADGWTPLHRAVFLKRKGLVEVLLAHGANIHAEDNFGNTPLTFAEGGAFVREEAGVREGSVSQYGDKDIAELLRQYGDRK